VLFGKNLLDKESLTGLVSGPRLTGSSVIDTEYGKLMKHFLRAIVGDTLYSDNINLTPIPQWANSGDEAATIILVENCWEQECAIKFEGKISADDFIKENATRAILNTEAWPSSKQAPPCKWSNGGPGSKGCQGWSREGVLRFNELQKKVQDWRPLTEGKNFYDAILAHEAALSEGKNNKRKRFDLDEVDEIEVVCNWEGV
jgi:hypothetical protein